MMAKKKLAVGLAIVAVVAIAISLPSGGPAAGTEEIGIVELRLAGGAEETRAELSGLAWYGDTLVLLPQFPERFPSEHGGSVFTLERADIERAVDEGGTLVVGTMSFDAPDLVRTIGGFEGFEAIVFDGDAVFVTVEAEIGGKTTAQLMKGVVDAAHREIAIDVANAVMLEPQTNIENLSYEALAMNDGKLLAFYEANGMVNAHPYVEVFDTNLVRLDPLPMRPLEYRLTDVTDVEDGHVWVMNYFYSGECWETGTCPLREQYGVGRSQRNTRTVERIVELDVGPNGVRPTRTAPIQLELEGHTNRNWEGIVRLGDRGFLIVTDEHPKTILAFVPR